MRRKLALIVASALLLVLTAAGAVSAQGTQTTGRLKGRVTRPDGAGLAGVAVRIDRLDQVVFTDTSGAYVFPRVPVAARRAFDTSPPAGLHWRARFSSGRSAAW